MEVAARYLDAGIDRVILGTAAVRDQAFLREAVAAYRERIAVGIDVKDGMVAVSGWTELSGHRLDEFAAMMQDEGVRTIICTDISRDGMLEGPSFDLYTQLQGQYPDIDFTVSGGLSSMDDVKKLNDLNLRKVIIGKAIYEGKISLKDIEKFITSSRN
jgi:phosphoribosylformimino-5-aminoimidazole carboxamide ribotide isomerase